MLDAMCRAPLGDDVYAEDPTVNRLEEITAEMLGTEPALFLPSATMSNLIAFLVQADAGEGVVLEAGAHMFYGESGGYAAICGLAPLALHRMDGARITGVEIAIVKVCAAAGHKRPTHKVNEPPNGPALPRQ
jgi:threonine aldolase